MTKSDFKAFIKDVGQYFGMKNIISEKRLDMWYTLCQDIPHSALLFIQLKIFTDRDSMPRNMPKYVKMYYRDWLYTNPDKLIKAKDYKSDCHHCKGEGLLFYIESGYRYVARCGDCKNWIDHFSEKTSQPRQLRRIDLENQGYQVEP